MKEAVILSTRIHDITLGEAVGRVVQWIENKEAGHYIVTPNPEILIRAHTDSAYGRVLNTASLAVPDGTGVVLASYTVGAPLRSRVPGVDLAVALSQEAAERGWRVGLWSPVPGVAARAVRVLQHAFPGFQGIPLNNETMARKTPGVREDLDLLFVALGAPHQEQWMYQHRRSDIARVMLGIGGALDMIAGAVPRAPSLLCRLGLEWLWRLAIEPKRIHRILRAVVLFPYYVARERIKNV